MSRSRRSILLGMGLLLALGSAGNAQPPLRPSRASSPPSALRTDQYGDPLPDGAIARLGTVRLRHAARVREMAFVANGRLLASLGDDCICHLWDSTTGREVGRFARPVTKAQTPEQMMLDLHFRHMVPQFAMQPETPAKIGTFSADGAFFIEGQDDGSIRAWELPGGKELAKFKAGANRGAALTSALSPDGRLAACADEEGLVRLWDVATRRELRQLQWPKKTAARLLFSPNSLKLAGTFNDEIRLWDVASGKRLRKYEGHDGEVTGLAFSPDSARLASAGADGTVRLWEMESEEEVRTISSGDGALSAVAFSPDGALLAAGGTMGQVHVWELPTGDVPRQFGARGSVVTSITFSPDGGTLVAATSDGLIRFWDKATGKERLPAQWIDKVLAVSFVDEGKVALGTTSGAFSRWDTAGKPLRAYRGPEGPVQVIDMARNGVAAWTDENGVTKLWSPLLGKEACALPGQAMPIYLAAFSPNGELLATVAADQVVHLWEVATGKDRFQINVMRSRTPVFHQGPGGLSQLAFAADGKTLATVMDGGKIKLWETATGQERCAFQARGGTIRIVAFSPDGALLATAGDDEAIRLWDPLTGKLRQSWLASHGRIRVVAFSPDGSILASGGDDGVVCTWNVATGAIHRRFEGHKGAVTALAFSPSGKGLISAGADWTALIWRTDAPAQAQRPATVSLPSSELESLWADLASEDAAVAYRAVGSLGGSSDSAAFLERRLKPVLPVEQEYVSRLLADLGDNRFPVREKAFRELERLEELAAPALRLALGKNHPPEVRRRAEQLCQKLDEPLPTPDRLRLQRAVEVLERIHTERCGHLLKALAEGAPEARFTQQARAALDRLTCSKLHAIADH
jgi:WD40 repeat protein